MMHDDEAIPGLDMETLLLGRDKLLDFILDHETLIHAGEPCLRERLNVMALVAHSLGLESSCDETWKLVRKLLELAYEANHDI